MIGFHLLASQPALRRAAMKRTEPAALDLHGATWGPQPDTYTMDPTAMRYEQYEICFAAKVSPCERDPMWSLGAQLELPAREQTLAYRQDCLQMLQHSGVLWASKLSAALGTLQSHRQRALPTHALQAAFGVAVQQALDIGMDRTEKRLAYLAELVRCSLAQVPGVTVRDRGRRLCAICSFTKVALALRPHPRIPLK